MTLVPGARLGPYEILASLGTGGMGEVYRARDPRLRRELAIKVLPSSVAGDTGFLARFQSEARAASALNHPNIVTIHDIGSAEGLSYILMELIDGRTLRQLLDGGPPPLKKTLQIAAQVAEGLAAAHARGIVHRDLKPENVMISRDGVVKILDFGLAKTTPLYAGRGDATGSYEAVATEAGSVVGTVGYMSPEQASGRSLDFRSDQFSFGTILYEMITGRRAWKKNSAAETLTAIIREDPHPPIEASAPGTPTALRWIVARCLAKEPDERYASTRDLARDLSTIKDHLSEISGTEIVARPGRSGARWRRALAAGLLAAAAVGAGALVTSLLRRPEKPPALPNWIQVGFRRGIVRSARFAPDDQTIAYSAAWDGDPSRVFSTRPPFTETRTLDLPPAKLLAISTRSELAFLRNPHFPTMLYQPGTLVRAGLEAGAGRDLLDDVLAADWSPDGSQLAVARRVGGKTRLEYPIGKALYESDRPISDVRISRDGAWIAFYEREDSGVSLVAIRVSDGSRRVLSEGWFTAEGLAWTADGREIWFTPQKQVRDTSPPMLAVTLAGERREVFRGPGQLRLHDIARDGRLLVARWDVQVGLRGSSPSAGHERELSTTDDSMLSDLSSDGRTILVYDRKSLFLRPTDGSPPVRLGEDTRGARLSPDGKWVLALPTKPPLYPLLVPVGAGDVRRVGNQTECEYVEWFPDGRRILCESPNPHGPFRMSVIEIDSGKTDELTIPADAAADFDEAGPISPDGSLVAGIGRSGDAWVLRMAGGPPRRFPAGPDGGRRPVGWSADGRQVFCQIVGDVPGKTERLDLATGRAERWRDLGPEDPAGLTRIGPVRVAADGRAWAYTHIRVLSNLYVVEGLK